MSPSFTATPGVGVRGLVSGTGTQGWPQARDCWPTPRQERLLQAALLEPDRAEEAWLAWRQQAGVGPRDRGEARLLPLVFARLASRRPDDRALARLEARHRATAVQNLRRLEALERAIHCLAAAGIDTLILKGAALILGYYEDPGSRPMSDLDLLVPTQRIEDARACLQTESWEMIAGDRHRDGAAQEHAAPLQQGPDRVLDLHRHALYECRWPEADVDFWEAAEPVQVGRERSLVLEPADQLLHVMVHGLRWAQVSPARWVADAFVIIEKKPDLDWSRLLAQAEARRLVPHVQSGLRYLRERLSAPVPEHVWARVEQLRTSRLERLAFEAQTQAPALRGLRLAPALHWDGWRRVEQSRAAPRGLPSLRLHLRATWGTASLTKAALWAISKALRRLGQILFWRPGPLRAETRDHD